MRVQSVKVLSNTRKLRECLSFQTSEKMSKKGKREENKMTKQQKNTWAINIYVSSILMYYITQNVKAYIVLSYPEVSDVTVNFADHDSHHVCLGILIYNRASS